MASRGLAGDPALAETLPESKSARWWIDEIPAARRKHLRIWLWTGAALTATTLVVGGITRLTESGLSIVDWAPIVGSVPPITNADWQEAFDRYKQYPEYVKLRPDMTLSEFKEIYFWEYLHRMIGRLIGMVFLIPFIFFWIRGYLNGPLLKRLLILFGLGGMQGLMGWYMVQSGLVDRPDVSHYRLAAHLILAFTIFACCVWFANDLLARPIRAMEATTRLSMLRELTVFLVVLTVQIFWGALVAGLEAGYVYPTFPLMDGGILPPNGLAKDPLLINLVENHATVQWIHRLLATVLLIGAINFIVKFRRNPAAARFHKWVFAFSGLIMLQYAFGVTTLLTHVEIPIAVTHQATALLIVGVLITFIHQVRESTPVPSTHSAPSELELAPGPR
jgi:cytochrome c oxidase assembly protein subunit 15